MSDATTTQLPLITVLMPVRNEERHLETALRSVLDNGYPVEKLDIVVVDGRSDDDTLGVLERLGPMSQVRVLDNPHRVVPTALNLGLQAARGEIIFRLDGHARFKFGYLLRAVQTLQQRPDLHAVGAAMITESASSTGEAIRLAQSSPFGVGNSLFRVQGREGLVDNLAFAGYRRHVFDWVGGFDEELVRNQDDEFNYRLRRKGLRLWMMADPGSVYEARGSYRSLWRQYRQYGFWKIRVMQKLGEVPSLRSVVPLVFLAAWMSAFAILPWSSIPLTLLAAAYALFLLAASRQGAGQSPRIRLGKAWAIVILHTSYGFGECVGILRFVLGWRWIGEWASLSRGASPRPALATEGSAT